MYYLYLILYICTSTRYIYSPRILLIPVIGAIPLSVATASIGGLNVEIVESEGGGPGNGEPDQRVGKDRGVHLDETRREVGKEETRVSLDGGQLGVEVHGVGLGPRTHQG